MALLVAIHCHPVRVAAQLTIRRGADRSAAAAAASVGAALLECQQLLSTESLVVSLRRRLNEILEVSPQEEVTQVDELAVLLILDVDHTPSVLATSDLLAVDNDVLLGADNGERDQALLLLVSLGLSFGLGCAIP